MLRSKKKNKGVKPTMRCGFDLDGVLCDANITLLRIIDQMTPEERKPIEQWYYMERKPLLDPEMVMNDEDQFLVITGRSKILQTLTTWWLQKFCPTYDRLIMVDLGPAYNCTNGEVKKWSEEQARRKAEVINKEKLDIYFDDNGDCVMKLRELCPNTKIIKYGGNYY